ncbi:MAG: cytochrome c oxidase assembly factor Coa1 family protein [Myxococcota bacterium]
MTPQGQVGAPAQQPGWFARNWKWLVGGGCLGSLMCCGLFGAITYFTAKKVIEGSPVFAEAIQKANSSPEVTAALGSPITPGGMLQGEVKDSGGTGTASLKVPIEGPKGKGTLYVEATKSGADWKFTSLTADVGGKSVNLLDQPSMKNLPGGGQPPPGGQPGQPPGADPGGAAPAGGPDIAPGEEPLPDDMPPPDEGAEGGG